MRFWPGKHRRAQSETTVGLRWTGEQLAMVALDRGREGAPRIAAWDEATARSADELRIALRRFVEQNDLRGQRCRLVLEGDDYSLRLVERPPNVPDEELTEATRWLVRDLIEFDADTALFAAQPVADSGVRGKPPLVFVVAARSEAVEPLCEAVRAVELDLQGIEIAETAMVALEARMPESVAAHAVLRVGDKASRFVVALERRLHLARSLPIDRAEVGQAIEVSLSAASADDPEVLARLDGLLLEIQRSLDYYESEFGLAPASRLTLLATDRDLDVLVPALSGALRPLHVETFTMESGFDLESPPDLDDTSGLMLAAGAALGDPNGLGDALVPQAFRSLGEGFGLLSVLRAAAVVAALTGLLLAMESSGLRGDRASLEAVLQSRHALEARLDEQREAARQASVANPEAELAKLEALRDTRLRMLRDLERGGLGEQRSFSGTLAGLARQSFDGLWLERIAIDEGGEAITLEGRTLRADAVPSLLRRLGSESAFEDRLFRALQMQRGELPGEPLGFRLATRDSDGDAP